MFQPHRNLSDEINRNIIQSEVEGGVYLRDLCHMATLEVTTQNTRYILVMERDGEAWIAGHPRFCPEPVLVHISGSNWGGSMLKMAFIGRGMHLEFRHPEYEGSVVTSEIKDIRVLSEAA